MYYCCMTSHLLLVEARRRAGLTQAELARRVGKAPSAISRWERAGADPSLTTLRDLVRGAGFDLAVGLVALDDHDLALVRRTLLQTPEERLNEMVQAVRAIETMVGANG